ncbi:MAG: ketopantoate reductase family protein [Desulfovermiculus sp.]
MNILILGVGAMGTLFGARLQAAGYTPVLLGRQADQMEIVAEQGLLVEELDRTRSTWPANVCLAPKDVCTPPDVVLVLVKSYATDAAVSSVLPYCHERTVFVTVQNGMGNWEQIAAHVPRERILAGVTAQGATRIGPGHIRHGGNGDTILGAVEVEPPDVLWDLIHIFRRAGLKCEATDRTLEHIWSKLFVNIGINAVTALTGVPNGWIADFKPAREVTQAAVGEAMQVAEARGIKPSLDTVDRVLAIAQATAWNHSSMLQDVRNKNQTEVEAINGIICRWGSEHNISTPVNMALKNLVHVLESKNREGS